jgi:hypothetical protein
VKGKVRWLIKLRSMRIGALVSSIDGGHVIAAPRV